MEAFVYVLACVGAAFGTMLIAHVVKRRNAQTAGADPSTDPIPVTDPFAPPGAAAGDFTKIKVGDMFLYLHTQYDVRGTVRFREDDARWVEHFVQSLDDCQIWMSVELDPDPVVIMWREIPNLGYLPDMSVVTYQGKVFEHNEHGRAQYTAEGTTGLPASGTMRYVDFVEREGHRHLTLEEFGEGTWRASIGQNIEPSFLTVFHMSA